MYNLKLLKSNYTIVINDIPCELCSTRPTAMITDEQYESSTDLQKLITKKLVSAEKVGNETTKEEVKVEVKHEEPTITPKVEPTKKEEVIEVKPINAEKEVINATNASLHTSENPVENTKTLVEEKNTVNENIVIADNRKETETLVTEEANVVQDIEIIATESNDGVATEPKKKGRRKK